MRLQHGLGLVSTYQHSNLMRTPPYFRNRWLPETDLQFLVRSFFVLVSPDGVPVFSLATSLRSVPCSRLCFERSVCSNTFAVVSAFSFYLSEPADRGVK